MAKRATPSNRICYRMGKQVEHVTDLGLVNYVQHPTNEKYVVFRFADPERAADFEQELSVRKIWFEKGEEQGRTRTFILYGIHRKNYKQAQALNFAVEGKHRTFIIKNGFFRWFLVLFSMGLATLALVGYCNDPDKVHAKEPKQEQLK